MVEPNPRARALATGNKPRAQAVRERVADPNDPAQTYAEALEGVDSERLENTPAEPDPASDEPEQPGEPERIEPAPETGGTGA